MSPRASEVAEAPSSTTRTHQSSRAVAEELKRRIFSSELLPGQQIRQEKIAQSIGVSRLPVREALRQLETEGLVTHEYNSGYSVARLSVSQFDQIYGLRRLVETAVLEAIPKPTRSQLARVRGLHKAVAAAADALELNKMRLLNRDFHFEIFKLSDMELYVDELDRIWTLAMPYHAVYLYGQDGRDRSVREHALMVEAVRLGQRDRLIELMDAHRAGSEQQMNLVLTH